MSISAMAACWGPDFPMSDPVERLIALALADGVSDDDDRIVNNTNLINHLRRKAGVSADDVLSVLSTLCFLDVLEDCGSYYRWNLAP